MRDLSHRFLSFVFLFILFFSLCPFAVNADTAPPSVSASSCILADADSGQILYAKNETSPVFPASTLKILTCLLALENCSLDEIVVVPESALAIEEGSSAIYVTPGEVLTMKDCVYTLMMASANDIANTIAEHIAGSIPSFVSMMNDRAKQLGAQHTHFTNTHGLHDKNNYTTAEDLVLIAKAAWAIPEYREILNTAQYSIAPTNYCDETRYYNQTHEMCRYLGSYYYSPCLGGKTGYTPEAGYCLISYAKQDDSDMTLLTVVMNCPRSGSQYQDTKALLEYGFHTFTAVSKPLKGIYLGQVPIYRDASLSEKLGYAKVYASQDLIYDISVDANTSPEFEVQAEFLQNLTYPVADGTPAGYLHYYLKGNKIASIPCEIIGADDLSALIDSAEKNPLDPSTPPHYLLPPLIMYIVAAAAFLIFLAFLFILRRHFLHSSR